MSKFMYGVEYLREYDPKDDEHVARKSRLFELPSGPKLLPDAFDCILARVRLPVCVCHLETHTPLDVGSESQGIYRLQQKVLYGSH